MLDDDYKKVNKQTDSGKKLVELIRSVIPPRTDKNWQSSRLDQQPIDQQCDHIGRFLQVISNKLSHKRSPNIWITFWAISNVTIM